MRNLFLAAVSLLVQIGIWFALGSLLVRILKLKEDAVKELIFGYLLYFALFELLAVPMTLAWAPLSLLAGIWGLFLGVLVLLSVIWLSLIHISGYHCTCVNLYAWHEHTVDDSCSGIYFNVREAVSYTHLELFPYRSGGLYHRTHWRKRSWKKHHL